MNADDVLIPNEPVRFTPRELDRALLHCTELGASDITIQTSNPIWAEIHGYLYPITSRPLSHTEAGDILNYIYGPNGTTQIASGRDVDTHYEIRPSRKERFRFRINGTGCLIDGHEGLQITIRTIPTDPPDISVMNLPQQILDSLAPEQGTVILTGSTGSGKSTLLASIIKRLAEDPEGHRKILTYEAPIEFVYDGVSKPNSIIAQSEIPRHLPNFASGVRNALRRKPRAILVGEARDAETIAAVIDAALTGHPVYTTLHSNGVADCVRRMVTTFPAEERHGRALDILETVRLIIWQRLVPTVDGKRVALREYLVFNDEVRDILVGTHLDHLTAKTREILKQYGQEMIVDVTQKYKDGIISEKIYTLMCKRAEGMDEDAQTA